MKTDRELLELAAKAAGRDPYFDGPHTPTSWSPLTDDGDALRLMVMLGLSVITEQFFVRVYTLHGALIVREEVGIDGYADTRRAIVNAAAEIGENMK